MSEERYQYCGDIESFVDMKNAADEGGLELVRNDVLHELNKVAQLEAKLDNTKKEVLSPTKKNTRLEAENERYKKYIDETCDEDYVMWCREQDQAGA